MFLLTIGYRLLARSLLTCSFVLSSRYLSCVQQQSMCNIIKEDIQCPSLKKSMKCVFEKKFPFPLNFCLSVAQMHLFARLHIFDIPRWSDLIPYITWLWGFPQPGEFFLPIINPKHSKRRTRSPV